MAIYKCKMCGGNLEITEGMNVCECEYCGSKQTVPTVDNEKIMKLYDRANRLRMANEFDKAFAVYESIIEEIDTEAEAYWGLVLCKYGIEYVTDTASGNKVPTCHRVTFDSLLEDKDLELVMENSDAISRNVYREQAKQIEEIRRGIIEVSGKEEPYDIFICYKETDENGDRTIDSVIAQETYDALISKGYRVFFSRITLEDKLGQEYEPYIFAALNSAKVMLAFGTSYDYYNAVWVKNEWARYIKLMEQDKTKHLIPCYKDIDAYDMPGEFKPLQAQDMGKVGAIQDLLRGIEKLTGKAENKSDKKQKSVIQQVVQAGTNVESLIKRGFDSLEDGIFKEAETFFNDALNSDAQNAQAYLGLFMVVVKVTNYEAAKKKYVEGDYTENRYWKRARQYATESIAEMLNTWEASRNERLQQEEDTLQKQKEEKREKIKLLHEQLYGEKYELTKEEQTEKERLEAVVENAKKAVENASNAFKNLPEIKEAQKIEESIDSKSKQLADLGFFKVKEKKNLQGQIDEMKGELGELNKKIQNRNQEIINLGKQLEIANESVILYETKKKRQAQLQIRNTLLKTISDIGFQGLIRDSMDEEIIKDLKKSIAHYEMVSAGGGHTVGLRADGRVVATGKNDYGQCNVEDWTDIIAVSAGDGHTVGLRADGSMVATGRNDFGQCDVYGWTDIIAVSAGHNYTVGLRADGRGLIISYMYADWDKYLSDIIAVSAGYFNMVGLRADGRVVVTGNNDDGQCNVEGWKDIIAVSAGYNYTIGLRADGRVVARGRNNYGQCDVYGWTDIIAVSACDYHTVGLRSDGSVVATGSYRHGQCNVKDWTDIIAVSAGEYHTVGLRADGRVVATGENDYGQCNVEDWTDIKLLS